MAKKTTKKQRTVSADLPAELIKSPRVVSEGQARNLTEPAAARWTFLTNHSHVLLVLAANPSTVLREVAALVGITERAVQRIIAELEEDGYVQREKVGRQNRYKILTGKSLRHPIEAHRTIGDLVGLIYGAP